MRNQLEKKLRVTKETIRLQALRFCSASENEKYKDFKCSINWIRKFYTYREATHQSQQKKRDQGHDFQIVKNFIISLREIAFEFKPNLILNMDETPAYFDMLDSKTIDFVGTKSVELLNSGHDKNRFSLV